MHDENYNYFNDILNSEEKLIFLESLINGIYETRENKLNCPVCGSKIKKFIPFKKYKSLMCPICGSLNMHRLSYYYINKHYDLNSDKLNLLVFNPEILDGYFNEFNINYTFSNFEELSNFEDDSFDLILDFNTLNKSEDYVNSLSELYRIVKPQSKGGYVLLNNSFNPHQIPTIKNYGKTNKFGIEFIYTLKNIGFGVDLINTLSLLDNPEDIKKYGLLSSNFIIGLYKYENEVKHFHFSFSDEIKFGEITFKRPPYYKIINNNEIFNGFTTINFSKTAGQDINTIIKNYQLFSEEKGNIPILNKIKINNLLVYKIEIFKTRTVRYWFSFEDNIYQIFTYSADENLDKTINFLITSIKKY